MSTEQGGRGQDSPESKSQKITAEQAQQILSTRPDALQSYLVATNPNRWYRSGALGGSAFISCYLSVVLTMWAVHFARTGRPMYSVYCSLAALAFPLLSIIAYFDIKRTAKGLTTDLKYREILRCAILVRVNAYLGICYILTFWALALTGNLTPSHVVK